MQLFYGTVTFDSAPVDTQDATVAKGHVVSTTERGVDTPVSIRAYGKTGTRMLSIKPKSRIQVTHGTLHRDKNYGYIINVYRYSYLPSEIDDMMFPDWHEIVLAGRTVKDLDKTDNRAFFTTDEFTVVKRGIAVNQGREKVDFFDVSAFSSHDDRMKKTDLITKYCATKGVFMLVRGNFNSKRGTKAGEDGSKPIFTDISINNITLGPKTGGDAPSSNGYSSNGNGYAAKPQEYMAAPVPGSQPQMPDTDEDLPF